MLEIVCSSTCKTERTYIIDWVMGEVFGVDYEIRFEEGMQGKVKIQARGRGEMKSLELADMFFEKAHKQWLQPSTLPERPIKEAVDLPVIFGADENQEQRGESTGEDMSLVSLDIFGSLFFLLSRYEEAVSKERDVHDRFPSDATWMGANNLWHRAIGNEYIELLWKHLQWAWPGLVRKKREFSVLPSHDVDHPSGVWGPWRRSLWKSGVALRRGQIRKGCSVLWRRLGYGRWGQWEDDPVDTLSWIMNISEENGYKSAFNYIPEQTDGKKDLGMPLSHPHVEEQWRRIAERGHEIGLHPGYNTYQNPELIKSGAQRVRQQMEHLCIKQEKLGGRQHYLRWQTPETARAWNDAGLDYDSTLGFAECSGFRCGVCYEFPLYDLENRKALNVRERPLVLMECSVIDDRYLGLGYNNKALQLMCELKNECRKFQGDFTVLWHNDRFIRVEEREMYQALLKH